MKVLFVGDIYGKTGLKAIKNELPKIIKNYGIDFTFVNANNANNGKVLNFNQYQVLVNSGVNAITLGNNVFDREKLLKFISKAPNILIPQNCNYKIKHPGTKIFKIKNLKIRITNLLGQYFVNTGQMPSCPFDSMEEIIKNDCSDFHLVDFHGKAAFEKTAFAYNFMDNISFLGGTHSGVQTADEKIIKSKTAFITDAGIASAVNSICGINPESAIKIMQKKLPLNFQEASGFYKICGVIIEFDVISKKPILINRINVFENI